MSNAAERVFVALGSNLGDSKAIVREAFRKLEALSKGPVSRSSLWSSTPVGCPPGSADFINAVAELAPTEQETPEALLKKLQELEKDFGRRPKEVMNEARPLDLDLIAWGSEMRSGPDLTLPHPRAHLRRFVLEPLAEIAPELILPGQEKTVRELLSGLSSGERVIRVERRFGG